MCVCGVKRIFHTKHNTLWKCRSGHSCFHIILVLYHTDRLQTVALLSNTVYSLWSRDITSLLWAKCEEISLNRNYRLSVRQDLHGFKKGKNYCGCRSVTGHELSPLHLHPTPPPSPLKKVRCTKCPPTIRVDSSNRKPETDLLPSRFSYTRNCGTEVPRAPIHCDVTSRQQHGASPHHSRLRNLTVVQHTEAELSVKFQLYANFLWCAGATTWFHQETEALQLAPTQLCKTTWNTGKKTIAAVVGFPVQYDATLTSYQELKTCVETHGSGDQLLCWAPVYVATGENNYM